ncbi:hypothetical protein [Sulfobacillus thermosulfidooxidans]|uniref:hypothetical protein n=1 Tax=Sulfobacillus thermosulfidooxidans TaxID=28034 RepID=UPI0006B585AC|nr:hypothetical protein [Sulfobacillus thermosulfidooxidans]
MRPALPPFLFTALLGISGGIMMPIALAMNLPLTQTLWPTLIHAEIVSFALAMGGMLVWRWMKNSQPGQIGARPLFTDLYMTLLGLMGFTDALEPQGSWQLTILAIIVSSLGLLSHFRSVTWSLSYIAPHWDAKASTAFAVMGPSLVSGFSIGLAMLAGVSHHPVVYSALSIVLFSLISVSFFFTLSLRSSLPLGIWTGLVIFLYLIPTICITYSLFSQNAWMASIAAISTIIGLIWHTKELLNKLPITPYPGLFFFQQSHHSEQIRGSRF